MNRKPWLDLISEEAIIEIHRECIARFGGDPGLRDPEGCIDRSTAAAWNAELYLDNPDAKKGLCFAACLLYYLAKNNCLVDGNKRVGWAACMEVLRCLGLTVIATDEDVEQLCVGFLIGTGTVKEAIEVSTWLAPRLQAL